MISTVIVIGYCTPDLDRQLKNAGNAHTKRTSLVPRLGQIVEAEQ